MWRILVAAKELQEILASLAFGNSITQKIKAGMPLAFPLLWILWT